MSLRRNLTAMALLAIFLPDSVFAVSFSSADLFRPSYGAASHFDGSLEWLGEFEGVNDGIFFDPSAQNEQSTMDVIINSAVSSRLWFSVWVDWEMDGVFDESDQVVDVRDQVFSAGENPLAFNITTPSDAVSGETWIRARLTFDGPLFPAETLSPVGTWEEGTYITGEVEDHRVTIGGITDPIPEPSTLALLGLSLGALGIRRFRLKA